MIVETAATGCVNGMKHSIVMRSLQTGERCASITGNVTFLGARRGVGPPGPGRTAPPRLGLAYYPKLPNRLQEKVIRRMQDQLANRR